MSQIASLMSKTSKSLISSYTMHEKNLILTLSAATVSQALVVLCYFLCGPSEALTVH